MIVPSAVLHCSFIMAPLPLYGFVKGINQPSQNLRHDLDFSNTKQSLMAYVRMNANFIPNTITKISDLNMADNAEMSVNRGTRLKQLVNSS